MKMLKEFFSKFKLYVTVHIMYTHRVSRLCTAHSNSTAETNILCSAVDIQCSMIIAAIATVSASQSAILLAL